MKPEVFVNLRVALRMPQMPDTLTVDLRRDTRSIDDAYAAPFRVHVSELDDEQIEAVGRQWAAEFAEHCKKLKEGMK